MNKYQESLDFIVKNSCPQKTTCMECNINNVCNSLAKEHIDRLQELVDKATPKKPRPLFLQMAFMPYKCPICEELVNDKKYKYKYCPNCGQKLDWSEEAEE